MENSRNPLRFISTYPKVLRYRNALFLISGLWKMGKTNMDEGQSLKLVDCNESINKSTTLLA